MPEVRRRHARAPGKQPSRVGWDIVCTSCEWQIKQVEELDIHQYPDLMEEIKLKVNAVQ